MSLQPVEITSLENGFASGVIKMIILLQKIFSPVSLAHLICVAGWKGGIRKICLSDYFCLILVLKYSGQV